MKDKMPYVSIGMPVYNGERYIADAVDSLLAQTLEDFELIISDNASTDRTAEICLAYVERDRRVRYLRNQENLGASRNYTRCFELSRGRYFKWANADDVCAPDLLARCAEALEHDRNAVLAYAKTKLIDEHGNVLSDYDDGLHLRSAKPSERFVQVVRNAALCNVQYGLMRPEVLRRTKLIEQYVASDKPFLAEMSLYGRFLEIPGSCFYRRIHPGAFSSQTDSRKLLSFYEPKTRRRLALVRWRHYWQYSGAVLRAPIGPLERLRLFCFLGRSVIWDRERLVAELWRAARQNVFNIRVSANADCHDGNG